MSNQQGLTLTELLVTLSILAIIATLALPSLHSLLEKQKADSITDKLYHHLNFARIEAINKNVSITVCASDNGTQCSKNNDWSRQMIMLFIDINHNGLLDPEDSIIKILNLNLAKNTLRWSSFRNKSYLQWRPSGMTYYQNGNFTYCPENRWSRHARKIILNADGRIYFGGDKNRDGIQEGADGENIVCP